jgi:hypothetical protein
MSQEMSTQYHMNNENVHMLYVNTVLYNVALQQEQTNEQSLSSFVS